MKFKAELLQFGNNTGIEIPPSVFASLGSGKRPKLRVTIKDFSVQITPGSTRGKVMIPVSAERRKQAGDAGGDILEITVVLDNSPLEMMREKAG